MSLLSKILLVLWGMTSIVAIAFIIYQQHQMQTMQTQINASIVAQKTMIDGITRSQSQYVTKDDLNAFATANNVNLAAIQKDVDSLGAAITGINQVTVNSGAVSGTNISSTSTTVNPTPPAAPTVTCDGQQVPCPNGDPYGYQQRIQNLQLNEPFTAPDQTPVTVPIGSVSFDASKPEPWSQNIFARKYSVSNVLATDPDGKQYVYNQVSITANGQTYKAPITTANYVQQYPSPSLSWWNPRLFLGLDGGVMMKAPLAGVWSPSLNFGFISYGSSKNSPDWSFVQLGVGYNSADQKVQFQLSPAQFNLHTTLPFIRSTFVGPTLSVDTNGNFAGLFGIRIGM